VLGAPLRRLCAVGPRLDFCCCCLFREIVTADHAVPYVNQSGKQRRKLRGVRALPLPPRQRRHHGARCAAPRLRAPRRQRAGAPNLRPRTDRFRALLADPPARRAGPAQLRRAPSIGCVRKGRGRWLALPGRSAAAPACADDEQQGPVTSSGMGMGLRAGKVGRTENLLGVCGASSSWLGPPATDASPQVRDVGNSPSPRPLGVRCQAWEGWLGAITTK